MSRRPYDTTEGCSGRPGCCPVLRADSVHDGASGQRRMVYYWQLQYYNDAHDASDRLKPSIFAQTLQEENDTFYAMFPDAKPPAESSGMVLGVIPDNRYHHGVGFFPPGCRISRAEKSDLSIQTMGLSSPKHDKPEHIAGRSNPCSTIRINTLTQSPIEQVDALINRSPHWIENDSPGGMMPPSPLSNLQDDDSASMIDDSEVSDYEGPGCETEDDYDSQWTETHPPQSRLSSPLEVDDDIQSPSSHGAHGGSIHDLDLRPSQATGTWPALKVRRNGSGSLPTPGPSNAAGPSIHTLTTYGRRSTTLPPSNQDSGSTTPASSTQESSDASNNNLMRLSPLPSHRRPVEKKKTQTLACNFCRGRKIACGPPVPGTVEKTCNQCQRRSLKCVFPTESRRGIRKKKLSTAPNDSDSQTASQSPLETRGTLEGEG